jgi:hypothetical protein
MAAGLWWLTATINCGGFECLPLVVFFYAGWYVPIVAYLAISEVAVRAASARWSPAVFLGFTLASFALLVTYFRFGPAPFLFSDAERAGVTRQLILEPAAWCAVLFVVKSLWHWYRSRLAGRLSTPR